MDAARELAMYPVDLICQQSALPSHRQKLGFDLRIAGRTRLLFALIRSGAVVFWSGDRGGHSNEYQKK